MTIHLVHPEEPPELPLESETTPAERDHGPLLHGDDLHDYGLEPDLPDLIEAHEPVKLEKTGITPQIPGELFEGVELLGETIAAKLHIVGMDLEAAGIRQCCQTFTVRTCKGCLDRRILPNHCDKFFCPKCQSRIARRRKSQVEWWTKLISQPKHVVLTVRNSDYLDANYIKACKDALVKLRRSKLARNWRGGCWSLEVTNEGRGWHVHFHLLIDAHWIDSKELALKWASLVQQDFAIVKVKDVRRADYLKEILKYAVKGSVLASWSPVQIRDFINALRGCRTFGIFGQLYGHRQAWKAVLDSLDTANHTCPCCGKSDFQYLDETEFRWRQMVNGFA